MPKKMTRSSGNVFRDLGFSAEEAENLRVRADLMASIRGIIEQDELTQADAAELFGVSQPRVSDLVRGKIELFQPLVMPQSPRLSFNQERSGYGVTY